MNLSRAMSQGIATTLSHPLLVILKWLLNLCFVLFVISPVYTLLSQDLDGSLLGQSLQNGLTEIYFYEFQERYAGEIGVITRMIWPAFIVYLLVNLFLSGGILQALQSKQHHGWKGFWSACARYFAPLIINLLLTIALAYAVIALPLFLLESALDWMESLTPTRDTLFRGYWYILGGFAVLSTLLMLLTGHLKQLVKSRIFLVVAVVIIGVLVLWLPLQVLDPFFTGMEARYPDQLFSFRAYWVGVGLILLFAGTWVIRVYHGGRLGICRPAENRGNLFADAIRQFFHSLKFQSTHYGGTLILWLFFVALQAGVWFLDNRLTGHATPETAIWQILLFGQLAIMARIALDFGFLGGLSAMMTPTSTPEPKPKTEPEPAYESEDDEILAWQKEQEEAQTATTPPQEPESEEREEPRERIVWEPQEPQVEAPDAVEPDPEPRERIVWEPQEPEPELPEPEPVQPEPAEKEPEPGPKPEPEPTPVPEPEAEPQKLEDAFKPAKEEPPPEEDPFGLKERRVWDEDKP